MSINNVEKSLRIGSPIVNATAGSVLFAGTGGILQQDNSNLFWDDTNNRLGIGDTSPDFTLDVAGTFNADTSINLNGANINTGGTLTNVAYLGSANTFTGGQQTINAPGSNPAEASLVVSAIANYDSVVINGSATAGQSYGLRIDAGSNSSDAALRVRSNDATSNLPLFHVRGDGAIGINTTSPGGMGDGGSPVILHTHGGSGYGLNILSSSATADGSNMGIITFGSTGLSTEKRTALIRSYKNDAGTTNALGSLAFETANGGAPTEKMRILANGNVGIGTTSPTATALGANRILDIAGATTPALAMHSTNSAQEVSIGSGGNGMYFDVSGHATASGNNIIVFRTEETNSQFSPTERMRIDSVGGIFMYTLAADTAHTDATICRDTTSKEILTGTGTLGICLGTSSERFKHDINDLNVGLSEILKLRPTNFYYKEGHGDNGVKKNYGLIAEEMLEVLPDLVGKDTEGKPSSADLLGVVPVLIKAIQEQQIQIEVLTERLNNLRV